MGPRSHGLYGGPSANWTGVSEEQGNLVVCVGALPKRHGASKTTDQLKHCQDVATCPFLLLYLVRPQEHSAKDWLYMKCSLIIETCKLQKIPHNGFICWYSLCTHICIHMCIYLCICLFVTLGDVSLSIDTCYPCCHFFKSYSHLYWEFYLWSIMVSRVNFISSGINSTLKERVSYWGMMKVPT